MNASITIGDSKIASIDRGLVVLVAYSVDDNNDNIKHIVRKIIGMRIFEDSIERLNLSINEIGGEILLVPNFSLYGNVQRGYRPDFTKSASFEISSPLFEATKKELSTYFPNAKYGVFGANMKISLINDGPLTIVYEY